MATKTYKPKRKISATESEEIKIPASSVVGAVSQVKINGETKTPDDSGLVDLGTISGGSGDNSKHGYTQLTNENLNTITDVGWYRAASGNTCTNKPSGVSTFPFVLMVEKSTDQNIKQTLYPILNSAISFYESHIRYYTGSSWSTWSKQQTMGDGQTQTFSGRKTFSTGINITNSLQANGSSGTAGQFFSTQGSNKAPKWVNIQVKVNGTTYTADSSGLIDLGTISGGASAVSFNDIY